MAPAHPQLTAQLRALCNVMTCGESTITATFHHHIKDVLDINTLTSYGNCYAISCHALAWKKQVDFHTKSVLQSRCTKILHPL